MKEFIAVIIPVFFCYSLTGQNIVPNSGFEDTIGCPDYVSIQGNDQIGNCPPWRCTTNGTPDYMNSCNNYPVNVPNSVFGYQLAHGGQAYIGLYSKYTPANYREYVTAPLLNTMLSGTNYYVHMFVSSACFSSPNCFSGTDGLGIYFSTGIPDTTGINWLPLPNNPQIFNSPGNIISDTMNWVEVSGIYLASGGETHITIGNFKNDANTLGSAGYYFIDDICVATDSNICNVITTNPLIIKPENIIVYPNPFTTEITISTSDENYFLSDIFIYNVFGQLINAKPILEFSKTNSVKIDMCEFKEGVYFLELKHGLSSSIIKIVKY